MLENLDKIMHFHFDFDDCPVHSPFGVVHLSPFGVMHLMHQNLSASIILPKFTCKDKYAVSH